MLRGGVELLAPSSELRWNRRIGRVIIKPLTRLLPMVAFRNHPAEEWRSLIALILICIEHDVGDANHGIQADEIQERQRPHRVATAELHGTIDIHGAAGPSCEGPHRVQQKWDEEQVDDEAGAVRRRHWLLAKCPGKRIRAIEG